jgi:membrane fusion protein, multidrug efflux system
MYTLSARITGHVNKVNAENNDSVKAWIVLLEIDPRDYEVALDRALGDMANVEARVAEANDVLPPLILGLSGAQQVPLP